MSRSYRITILALGLAGAVGGVWQMSQRRGSEEEDRPLRAGDTKKAKWAGRVSDTSPLNEAPPPKPPPATAGFRKDPEAVRYVEYEDFLIRRVKYNGTEEIEYLHLELSPEIIEFEGFVNYGAPVEINAETASGAPIRLVLTESRIEHPVLSTRTLTPEEPPLSKNAP